MDTDNAVRLPLSKGRVALIDPSDYDAVLSCTYRDGTTASARPCDHRWHVRSSRWGLYAETYVNSRHVYLHRLVAGAGQLELVDHQDGDGLNCRRSNLRIATHASNSWNQRKPRGQFASKYKGVVLRRAVGRFQAQIQADRQWHYLGIFETEEDAARAYDEAARRLHGDFAKTNF